MYSRFGAETTLVELLPRLVPLEDEEVSKELERSFRKRGIKSQVDTKLEKLEKTETGKLLITFQYNDKGSLATVGRNLALAEIGKLKLKGFVAWFVWMLVHLMSIIGIKNRLFVLINWMWQYFTYDQSLRLIIKPAVKPINKTI